MLLSFSSWEELFKFCFRVALSGIILNSLNISDNIGCNLSWTTRVV